MTQDAPLISALEGEEIIGGEPTFPPVIKLDIFERSYPMMHGATIYVQAVDEYNGIVVGVAHPEMRAGLYLGVSPEMARNIAAWLLSSADILDGGRGKQ